MLFGEMDAAIEAALPAVVSFDMKGNGRTMNRRRTLPIMMTLLAVLFAGLGSHLRPAITHAAVTVTCLSRGQPINPVPDKTEWIAAGVRFAGIVYTGNGLMRDIGSDVTFVETGFGYTATPHLYGTKGFCGGTSEAEATLTAVELAEGERALAMTEPGGTNRQISMFGGEFLVYPVDERSVDATILNQGSIRVGDEVRLEYYAQHSTKALIKWGDNSPNFDGGYQTSTQVTSHIYSQPGTYNIEFSNSSDKFVQRTIQVLPALVPEFTLHISPNPVPYGAVVTATLTTNMAGRLCMDWNTNDGRTDDRACRDFGEGGGTFAVPHVYDIPQGGSVDVSVYWNDTEVRNGVITLLPRPAPKVPNVTIKIVSDGRKAGDLIIFELEALTGNTNVFGKFNFGDGQSTARMELAPGQIVRVEHVYGNSCPAKTYTMMFDSENGHDSTAQITIQPLVCTIYLPMMFTPALQVEVQHSVVLTYPDQGQQIEFTVTTNGSVTYTLDFGDGDNTGPRVLKAAGSDMFRHDFKPNRDYTLVLRDNNGTQLWTGSLSTHPSVAHNHGR